MIKSKHLLVALVFLFGCSKSYKTARLMELNDGVITVESIDTAKYMIGDIILNKHYHPAVIKEFIKK